MLRQQLIRLENCAHQDECRSTLKPQLIVIVAAVLLLGCGNPDGATIQATKDGNIEAAKQAIADGADVNERGKYDWTSLHHATTNGHKEIAKLLVAEGADVNAKTRKLLKRSLDQAEDEETVDLLRKHGGKTGEELKDEGK